MENMRSLCKLLEQKGFYKLLQKSAVNFQLTEIREFDETT